MATLHHQPGHVMFVDWVGNTIPIQDAITGAITLAYLFEAVLPFSGLIFAWAFANMRMEAWLDGHIGAFEAFGGVTPLVVPELALTATHQRERGDAARFLHERYRQLSVHYGAAVLPACVRTPRANAAVESVLNTINKRILAPLLEEVWSNLPEGARTESCV